MSVNHKELAEMSMERMNLSHGELAEALNKLRIMEPEAIEHVFNPKCSSTPEKSSYVMEMKVKKKRYRTHHNSMWINARKSLKF